MVTSAKPTSELIQTYLNIRRTVEHLESEHKKQMKPYKEALSSIEVVLLDRAHKDGVQSFPVKGIGTAYRVVKTSATVKSWSETLPFIRKEELWNLLEHRVNKTAIKEYMEENNGELPPGIKWVEFETINIRRS